MAFDKVTEVYSQIPNDLNTEGKREALGFIVALKKNYKMIYKIKTLI